MRTKKNFLRVFVSMVVVGLSIYAGYKTYDDYTKVNEADLLIADVETFVNGDEVWNPNCHSGSEVCDSSSVDGGITITGYGVSASCDASCN